ncbi:hypothetical protein [Wenyingzhuangia sp. 2_MG-2023]|uniref:hypothetical protein n=1 Tax=Wenyingzhuangia sp. 2_MG-2023 TaxID=3062639 RepID=UPI0026E47E73|nr:hypothetical protein [Wenyingzhuangia sp. 2_MG-2023]MDO6738966.1 hypothetical protein [Wenyingzhuangia sp. 2_MG-2023]MDO6803721.1 hypothetical protein [Wenyingzhuangia sp. 1_MG-2023]
MMKKSLKHKFRGKSPVQIVGMVILGIIAVVGLMILFGFVIMWLWNWLMPTIFGLPMLSYWQAVGLFALSKCLLGGMCGGGGGSKKRSKKHDWDCKNNSKTEFSKWKYYDQFWKEEGDAHFQEFVAKQTEQKETLNRE